MQFRDEGVFEQENMLLGYIRNNFVAYISMLNSLSVGRTPFTVLHGPLVRAIGPFSELFFDYEAARSLLTVNIDTAGEFDIPSASTAAIQGDGATTYNLPLVPREAIDGDTNLGKFNEFCLKQCGRRCASSKVYQDQDAVPPNQQRVTKRMIESRRYPGFCLYFWILRSLFDLSRLSQTMVTSVVENTAAATEMSRIVLPSFVAQPGMATTFQQSGLNAALRRINTDFTRQAGRADLYRTTANVIKQLRLTDSNIFTYILNEGQYTSPVQIYRYQPLRLNRKSLAENFGIIGEFEDFLEALFPAELPNNTHPGYRVLMSYVRTTPLREPIRVEYFDLPQYNPPERVIGALFLLSLPYQEYGLPIILYYADKVARTPTQLVRSIIEREFFELVLQNRFSDPVSIMTVLGRFARGYFQREGLR